MFESRSLFGDCHEMAHIWAKIQVLTSFPRSVLLEPAASTMQKINPVDCFNLCHWRFVYIHLFLIIWRKSSKSDFQSWRKKFLQGFLSFFVKWLLKYLSLAVLNSLKIEHLCHIIPEAQIWLVLNLPVFMFVYIHFNVPPTRITDLVRHVSDEKIYWYGTFTLSAGMFLLLSTWFVFSQ